MNQPPTVKGDTDNMSDNLIGVRRTSTGIVGSLVVTFCDDNGVDNVISAAALGLGEKCVLRVERMIVVGSSHRARFWLFRNHARLLALPPGDFNNLAINVPIGGLLHYDLRDGAQHVVAYILAHNAVNVFEGGQ